MVNKIDKLKKQTELRIEATRIWDFQHCISNHWRIHVLHYENPNKAYYLFASEVCVAWAEKTSCERFCLFEVVELDGEEI